MNDKDPPHGPGFEECQHWCASFLEGVVSFLERNTRNPKRDLKYIANPGEVYRVRFDHLGVVRVTEWRTGRHVVSSLPGRPTEPHMGALPRHRHTTAQVITFPRKKP